MVFAEKHGCRVLRFTLQTRQESLLIGLGTETTSYTIIGTEEEYFAERLVRVKYRDNQPTQLAPLGHSETRPNEDTGHTQPTRHRRRRQLRTQGTARTVVG